METSVLFCGSSGNISQLHQQNVTTLWNCWLGDHSNYMFYFCWTNSFLYECIFLRCISFRKINLFKGNRSSLKKCFKYLLKKIVWINLLLPDLVLFFFCNVIISICMDVFMRYISFSRKKWNRYSLGI